MLGRSNSNSTLIFALVALPLVASPFGIANSQEINTSPAQSIASRLDDLSATAISDDLKERNIDPLLGSDDLRRAFIRYNLAVGGTFYLNQNSEDAAKSARALNTAMGELKLTSNVQVSTTKPGARIRYRLIGETEVGAFPQLSNSAQDDLRIGIYLIWAERNGTATSTPMQQRIIKPQFSIVLEEKAS